MKKVFGLQAEINIIADDDVARGVGKGLRNGSEVLTDIIKEIKPILSDSIKKHFDKSIQKHENEETMRN